MILGCIWGFQTMTLLLTCGIRTGCISWCIQLKVLFDRNALGGGCFTTMMHHKDAEHIEQDAHSTIIYCATHLPGLSDANLDVYKEVILFSLHFQTWWGYLKGLIMVKYYWPPIACRDKEPEGRLMSVGIIVMMIVACEPLWSGDNYDCATRSLLGVKAQLWWIWIAEEKEGVRIARGLIETLHVCFLLLCKRPMEKYCTVVKRLRCSIAVI